MMDKKGVELSMNVIIIAAIGLLILVILAVLVINGTSNVPGTMKTCTIKGGVCQDAGTACSGEILADGKCNDGLECCRPFTAQLPQ